MARNYTELASTVRYRVNIKLRGNRVVKSAAALRRVPATFVSSKFLVYRSRTGFFLA